MSKNQRTIPVSTVESTEVTAITEELQLPVAKVSSLEEGYVKIKMGQRGVQYQGASREIDPEVRAELRKDLNEVVIRESDLQYLVPGCYEIVEKAQKNTGKST